MQKNKLSRQQGVTLLLSIILLAAIVAITFSIATVLMVEIRSSGDLSRTEPTWYAASASTEEYLFQVRKKISSAGFPFTTSVNNISVAGNINSVTDPIEQLKVSAGSNSFAATQNHYQFYNPSVSAGHNPYTDPSGYSKVQITYLNTAVGGQVHVYLCQFIPTQSFDCTNPNNSSFMIYQDTTPLNQGDTVTIDASSGFDPAKQQELIIYGSGTYDRYIQIKTWDLNGVPKGLPYYGTTAVDIHGTGASITRGVRLKIPNN